MRKLKVYLKKIITAVNGSFFGQAGRAGTCLKNTFYEMCAAIYGIFLLHSINIVRKAEEGEKALTRKMLKTGAYSSDRGYRKRADANILSQNMSVIKWTDFSEMEIRKRRGKRIRSVFFWLSGPGDREDFSFEKKPSVRQYYLTDGCLQNWCFKKSVP